MHCILLLPGRSLHLSKRRTHNHFYIFSAYPACRATAVHGCIPATQYNDSFAYLVCMFECYVGQPVDAYVNIGCPLFTTRQWKIATLRSPASNEYCIVVFI